MSAAGGRARAWLELARVSNVPTVMSNALTGVAIGLASAGAADAAPHAAPVVSASAGMVAIYVAGMFLNDAADAAVDARERPGRPIPSGRIARGAAWGAGAALLVAGVALCAPGGCAALVLGAILAAAVVAYDLLHKLTPASIVLMGLCRALVYLTVAASVHWPLDWRTAAPFAGALGLYVILLSVVARVEAAPRPPAGHGRLILPLVLAALAPVAFFWPPVHPVAVAMTGAVVVAFLGWSIRFLATRPPRIGWAVSEWLAAICLMDGYYLFILDHPWPASATSVCFLATAFGHRRVKGT